MANDTDLVALNALKVTKAKDLARRLVANQVPFASFVECRTDVLGEVVVMDLDVEVPQLCAHDIRRRERLAVRFDYSDLRYPLVSPLRDDFPDVPHLNLTDEGEPKCICLFDLPYADIRSRLTMPMFVERIREWLRLTSRGELHAADQPLEPLLVGGIGTIILPHAVLDRPDPAAVPVALTLTRQKDRRGKLVLVAESAAKTSVAPSVPVFAGAVFYAEPRTHGLLTVRPTTIAALHDFLQVCGDDFLGKLRSALRNWIHSPDALTARLVIIVVAPKTRDVGGRAESCDIWAFLADKTISQLGVDVGVFELHNGVVGQLMKIDEALRGENTSIDLLNATTSLSRDRSAFLSGRDKADNRLIVAIGVGALGSQVAVNAARIAYGRWTLVDGDLFLPHNIPRHSLPAGVVGVPKALGVAVFANAVSDSTDTAFDGLAADVLDPEGDGDLLAERLVAAELIVDMSASVTVGRYLSRVAVGNARRLSLFLNPTGTDLVLLSESSDRCSQLDVVEMQYYRMLLRDSALAEHLAPPADRVRYGRSCRDVSVRISQELVGQHAAIGMRAIRSAADSDPACIRVWRSKLDTGEVALHEAEVQPTVRYTVGGWTVVLDRGFLRSVAQSRLDRLPSETGGVLLGSFDLDRHIVYVVDTLATPPDSDERPTWFIRGSLGLPQSVAVAADVTGGQVEYIGEWHSHPRGHSCHPSIADAKLFAWLNDCLGALGLPATMLIVGDDEAIAVFGGAMVQAEILDDHRIAAVAVGPITAN